MMKNKDDNQKKYSKRFLVQPDAGLGNRLYCLYSALYYSMKLHRPFDVIWLRENCCNVRYEDLFDISGLYGEDKKVIYRPRIITTYHLGYRNMYAPVTIISNLFMKYIKWKFTYYTSEDTRAIFFGEGTEQIEKIISEDNSICIKANGNFINMNDYQKVVHMIRPSQEIVRIVNEIMDPYEKKKVCGVHIRRTDNKTSIDNSPLELFKEKMQKEIDENRDTYFYLASDDEDVIDELKNQFNIIPHKKLSEKISRGSITGMKDAYIDMLCLARCEYIYGSYGSSFSDLAALIGNKHLEIVRGN